MKTMDNKNTLYIIIGLAIALIITGVLLPIGLNDLISYTGVYNSTQDGGETYNSGTSSTMATLVGTVLPVMIVISIVLSVVGLVSKGKK